MGTGGGMAWDAAGGLGGVTACVPKHCRDKGCCLHGSLPAAPWGAGVPRGNAQGASGERAGAGWRDHPPPQLPWEMTPPPALEQAPISQHPLITEALGMQ